ncbi:hypothetical protein [Streptococcus ferus]|uniref:Uncharacterized protein n=1 Tax=Streptococcus ferus TaxID=1345 RepID=A0A2X3VM84_9STRE|nr:hypothetical protein [Streptococcus ferus]SQF40538.1 Uncharacterised protein [Streptococcus ferus]
MLTKKQNRLIIIFSIILSFLAGGLIFGYLHYQSGAYEHNSTCDQLNSLMTIRKFI